MAQGPHLTSEIRSLIAQIHLDHPDYGPTSLHKNLLKRMKDMGLDRNFGSNWPGVGAVGKVLSDIRRRENELGPDTEDKSWSMSTLQRYPIPLEAIPLILKVNSFVKKQNDDDFPFTIREAKWLSRLSALEYEPAVLMMLAYVYSMAERIHSILGTPFDSTKYDMKYLSNWPKDLKRLKKILMEENIDDLSYDFLDNLTSDFEKLVKEVNPDYKTEEDRHKECHDAWILRQKGKKGGKQ